MAVTMLLSLALGPIIGILGMLLSAKLQQWVGNSLGGRASFEQVKASAAWSSIPAVVNYLVFLPAITLSSQYLVNAVGIENLNSGVSLTPQVLVPSGLICGSLIPMAILGIWSWVLNIVCIAEVHDFSIGRAILRAK